MADSKSGPSSNSPSGLKAKAPNLFERAKEEFEAVMRNGKHKHKETHGLREDIDANTPTSHVKAPNVFERAKEEIEAIVEAIHPKKEAKDHDGEKMNCAAKDCAKPELHSEKKGKAAANPNEKAKEGSEHKPHHHKETHGRSDEINENTPTSAVKGPNVFARAKEEIEAIIDTIHPKKESGGTPR